jgi:hypothetical protein
MKEETMISMFKQTPRFLPLIAAVALVACGCGKTEPPAGDAKAKTDGHGHDHAHKHDADVAKKPHDHSGWWCDEHGIPEAECSMCSAKVASEAKKKGEWCEEHDRAKYQCFKCDPKLKEKYAAKYRAKYGKEPPPIDD